ncbi:hypothetical protein [Arcobacter roscoffensis]|uniref:RNase H type-1 domain-containing protein n=1 Tax=Arcobacter roscoffensis TaxID=2961520 RepID=A0ABY5E5W3_9BACT|nr:hypothetical protein [Arcobacter roscoffensis]UTJ07116.1 hypothetical protein NJU99_03185 [Arcobacter roscoffensis]
MKTNTFFISDASYCSLTKIAVIASLCPIRNIQKTLTLKNIDSVNKAETLAVLLSIKLAIKYKIKNAVFIYDNNSVDRLLIENIFQSSFDCIQLLWVKRDLIKSVDKLARDTFRELVFPVERTEKSLKNSIVNIFKQYDDNLKIKAAMKIANKKEYKVLETFLNNRYRLESLHEVKLKNTGLMKFVYQTLSDEKKKKFYSYLEKVVPKVKTTKQFKQYQKYEVLYTYIENIKEKVFLYNPFKNVKNTASIS